MAGQCTAIHEAYFMTIICYGWLWFKNFSVINGLVSKVQKIIFHIFEITDLLSRMAEIRNTWFMLVISNAGMFTTMNSVYEVA